MQNQKKTSKRKFQIFISSTYNDLIEERDQVIKAILEMGHIPVGMEMFSAGDEEQWKLIERQIIDSDYYIILVAHRYGSVTKEGISYTEKEFDYAVSIGIPVLGFVIDDNATWPSSRIDKGKEYKKLQNFKTKVKSRLVNFWHSKKDLHALIPISLVKSFENKPRPGWIRAEKDILSYTLNEFYGHQQTEYTRLVNTARQIVNGLNPGKNIQDIKFEFESTDLTYEIDQDGMVKIEQLIELIALDDIMYFSIWIEGDSYCTPVKSIYDLKFKVISTDSQKELAFTQILDLESKIDVAIWFTPFLPKGTKERIKITYEWKGYFGRLLNNKEDELELFFRSKQQGKLKHLSASFITSNLLKPIKISSIGAKMPDEQITTTRNLLGGYVVRYESNNESLSNSKILLKMNF